MNLDEAALCLSKLGHPARLKVFRLLIRHGEAGLTVGDIQQRLDIAATTLNHHLEHLIKGQWIRKQRDGREVYCIADFKRMDGLIKFLMDDCCIDEDAAR